MFRGSIRTIVAIILWLVTATPDCSAQNYTGVTEYNVISLSPVAAMTKIGTDSWASGGTGVSEIGLASAAFNNPAALRFGALSATAEFVYKAKANRASDLDYDGVAIAPCFASIGMPDHGWNFSLSYANTYNQRLELPPIPVTTAEFPEGTGEFFSYTRTIKIHAFAGSLSYAVNEQLSFGATVGLNAVRLDETLWQASAKATGTGLLAILGISARPVPSLTAGAAFKTSPKISLNLDYTPPPSIDPAGGDPGIRPVIQMPDFVAILPWIIDIGASWEAPSVRIQSSLEYQHWSSLSDIYENVLQFHIGAIYAPFPTLSLRLGFFTQSDPANSAFSQDFLTGGARISIGELDLSLAILDSHLFGNSDFTTMYGADAKQFHQTILQGGLSYAF